jgi:hypothetical protein
MNHKGRGSSTIIGLAAVGPAIVGIVSFVAAFLPLLAADFTGAGLLFIASALSFGLLSVAVLGG